MPQVVVAAVGAGAAAWLGGAATAVIVANAVVAGGLALIGSFLAPKPRSPSVPNFTAQAQDRKFLVRSTVAPRRVIYGRAKVAGALIYAGTSGDSNQHLHLVMALAGHPCAEVESIWLNDDELPALDGSGFVSEGKYAGNVRIDLHLGASDQAADTNLVNEIEEWTASHRLRGITYAHVRLTAVSGLWPTGIPQVRFLIKGKTDIYDPRDSSTGWSDNAALCQRDYITGSHGLADPDVDDTTWSTAATRCDELVSLADETTEKRYTCNGAFELDAQPMDILEDLLTASGGRAVFSGGVWRGYAAGYETPAKSITADDLRDGLTVSPRPGRASMFNGVRGTFIDHRDQLYAPTDFPPLTNPHYETEDGEQVLRDLEFPFTVGHERAQRLAKIELERHRQSVTATLPLKTVAHELRPWDTIDVTISQLGWSAKVFRVIDWRLREDGGADVTVTEEAEAVYDWNDGEATQFDPAPNTRLPSPFDVPDVPGLALSERLYSAREGAGVKAALTATWTAPDSAFVHHYEVQHYAPAATGFSASYLVTTTQWESLDVQPGTHQVRVRAINGLNVPGAWNTRTIEVLGLSAAPTDITGLTITAVGGVAILRFDQHPDLDVRMGGVIVCRHSAAQTGADWNASRTIGRALTGNQTVMVLPLLPGTYLLKARDSSGIYSPNPATVSTRGVSVQAFTTLTTLTEGPVFSGTHTNTVNAGGVLKLDAGANIDSWADFDAVANIDAEGGILPSGTYLFSAGIDLTTVKTVRLTADYQATVSNVLDQWDSRGAEIDTWAAVDGDIEGDEADIVVDVRATDDDPTGTPTWSAWNALDVGDYQARAFQFRARLTSTDTSYNIETDQIVITAQEAA